MSTLRISNIEAKADISNPTVNEKVKITNSSGKVLVQVDGSSAGITSIGINTTSTSFTIDGNQNVQFVGIITTSELRVGTGVTISSGIVSAISATVSNNLTVGTGVTIQSGIVSATDYYASAQRRVVAFAVGTTTLFHQAAAPTGWTKSTSHNNKALRVVSGTGGGSGGSTAFTSVFASRTPTGSVSGSNSGGGVSNHTLSVGELASHSHRIPMYTTDNEAGGRGAPITGDFTNRVFVTAPMNVATEGTGSNSGHSHGFSNPSWSGSFSGSALDFAVQYIDIILCAID
jgi:hypothetical protein